MQESIQNERELVPIMEYVGALEYSDGLIDDYIKFWQEMLESGAT